MKNLKNKLRNNKKGFTLVEIIVVLVILAILAAAAIPTMLGFVEDAKGKSEIANARAAYVACQSIATEEQVSGVATKTLEDGETYTIYKAVPSKDSKINNVKLNHMLGADLDGATVKPTIDAGKVTNVEFVNGVYTVTINSGKDTTVVKNK